MSKTNFEYLKDICVGNDKAIEFIEAAEREHAEPLKTNRALIADNEELEKENGELSEKCDAFEEEPEYPHTIDVGIGVINWDSDNLQLILLMEALEQKIQSVGPLKALRLLDVRPKPALK